MTEGAIVRILVEVVTVSLLLSGAVRAQNVDLAALPCNGEGTVKSGSGDATTIQFQNASSEIVAVFWLNSIGQRVKYATLQPGRQTDRNLELLGRAMV